MLTIVQEKPTQATNKVSENDIVLAMLHLEFDQTGLITQIKPIYPNPIDGKALIQYFRVNRYRKIPPGKDHVFAVNKYVDSFFVKIENNNGDFVIVEKG
jgi:hypothetical protein